MPQCLDCGKVEGPLGQYHTCMACHLARGWGEASFPRSLPRYQPETEIRIRDADVTALVAGVGKQEVHAVIKKKRTGPSPYLTYTYKLPRSRFEREDPI